MRFGFVTCVQLGLSCMEAIYECGGVLDLAVTLPDDMARSKSGRVYLDDFCARYGIDLLKVRNVNDPAVVDAVRARSIDWLFIIGWSQIARQEVLAAPAKGVLGMHPTLLPEGRGRAAIPWAILKQLPRTGVTMLKLDEGVDTGPIVAQREIELSDDTTATDLYRAVDKAHVSLMKEALPGLRDGTVTLRAQDDALATEWPGRNREDGRIDLQGSVAEAARLIRAVTKPYPGAFVERGGRRLIVWDAEPCPDPDKGGGMPVIELRDGCLRCVEWEYGPIQD